MLPTATTSAAQIVYAIASSSVAVTNGAIPLFVQIAGILFAFFAAFAIFYAVLNASRRV